MTLIAKNENVHHMRAQCFFKYESGITKEHRICREYRELLSLFMRNVYISRFINRYPVDRMKSEYHEWFKMKDIPGIVEFMLAVVAVRVEWQLREQQKTSNTDHNSYLSHSIGHPRRSGNTQLSTDRLNECAPGDGAPNTSELRHHRRTPEQHNTSR